MRNIVVLMISDPVIVLDLQEMLQAALGDVRFVSPSSETESAALSGQVAVIVLDHRNTRKLAGRALLRGVPRLYVNVKPDDQSEGLCAHIEEPFTNGCVTRALSSLGLVEAAIQ